MIKFKQLLSEAKLMEQQVKAFEYEYLHGVSKQEAWSKSLNYMKMVYGESWMYKVRADENYWKHKQRVRLENLIELCKRQHFKHVHEFLVL